jgi:hypothetical protein
VLEVARELAEESEESLIQAAIASNDGDSQTAFLLFKEVGTRRADPDLLLEFGRLTPLPEAAVVGMTVGVSSQLGDSWLDRTLETWLSDTRLATLVVRTAHMVEATPRRAELSTQAARQGAVPSIELGRLLYGAWAKDLPTDAVTDLIKELITAGSGAIEGALGILDQWLEQEGNELDEGLISIAKDLLEKSVEADEYVGTGMVPYLRERLLARLPTSFEERLRLAIQALRSERFPQESDLVLLDALCQEDPAQVVGVIVSELSGAIQSGQYQPWMTWVEGAHLLSRLQQCASGDLVVQEVLKLDASVWSQLFGHVDFHTASPDPLAVTLISETDDEVLRARASFRFMYPSSWSGPESEMLKGRRDIATKWAELDLGPAFSQWIDSTIQKLNERIIDAEEKEAERGY